MWILAVVAAVCACFWGAVVMMHRLLIRRAAFEAFRKLYYHLLRARTRRDRGRVPPPSSVADLALGLYFLCVI